MTFSLEQEQEVIATAAQLLADRTEASILATYGKTLGEVVAIPVGLAARVVGITPQHARRVLPVIEQPGVQATVQFGDILNYQRSRKVR